MFNKELFILAHQMGELSFYPTYRNLIKNQYRSSFDLKIEQEKKLRRMIFFAYESVPYYHKLFKELKIHPADVRNIEDLQKIPVLTKELIKQHWDDLKPTNLAKMKYYHEATGGSTGTPLQYRLLKFDRFLSGALLYRGWGYAGYQLGDKMVFLAGTSLDIGTKSYVVTKAHELARNLRKLSSFDMGEKEMKEYTRLINTFKPKFIRGYASSIFFFAQWLEDNDIKIHNPQAVFTTAEKLFPNMRTIIGRSFGCDVFDAYGLNDGGLSAYECPEQSGLHIDTERSIMEFVGSNGEQIEEGEGRIVATSLHNCAFPFIRYITGDLGSVTSDMCPCGRGSKLLSNISGREKEFLITPLGQYVHGAALFNLIFNTLENTKYRNVVNTIKEFQIVQKKKDMLEIRIICDGEISAEVLSYIRSAIENRFSGWTIEFRFVDKIDRSRAGKYKFIINEMMNG